MNITLKKVKIAKEINMDNLLLETIRKMNEQFEKFLRACKAEGDTTIDDVLKRLEELKKET